METRYNLIWVCLSFVVAILASYVALNLAQSVTQTKGRSQSLWLACGALAMGFGIWSMHFTGMLAFEMPGMTMAYDVPLMLLSMAVAIGASALALFIVSRPTVPMVSILSGGIAMAAAIAGMHYIGMASMRMAATIQWNLYLVILSIAIALAASFGSLFMLIRVRDKKEDRFWELIGASTLMGIGIAGMHYTGMLAATYIHNPTSVIDGSDLLVSSGLAFTVFLSTLIILGIALASSLSQKIWNRKTTEAIDKSEEKFRRLVEAVKDYAIFMLDTNGYITTWNSGAERINGYSESEVLGKHISIFYLPKDIENQTANKEMIAAKELGHFEDEVQRVRKDGSVYWSHVVINPLYDDKGVLTGFSKVTHDITQTKEVEARLRELNEELEERVQARTRALTYRENQFRTIADAVPVLIAQMNQTETIVFANKAFCSWFNRDHKDVIGKTFAELLGAERYDENRAYVKRTLSGEAVNYERESKSGPRNAVLSITMIPEFGMGKSVTGFIVVANDITRQKEIQAELKSAKEAAEVANSTKSAFLANMSHEIRTPLGAVLGFSQLLVSDEMTPSERNDSVEIIKRNGELLSNIINDILDLSKVEAGRLDVEKVEVPFTEILKEMSSVLNLEAGAKGIALKVTFVGALPEKIKTDPLRLRQILFNIVGNAIKFTNKGTVTVLVGLVPNQASSTMLSFAVTDTGTGIEPELAGKLFKPFTQVDVSTTRKFGGTGLGLALSKKLAQLLGGDVVLTQSAPGKGSTFTITIDPGISEHVFFQGDQSVQTFAGSNSKARGKVNLSQHKILVVDDSVDNQILITKILKLTGAEVETANNGAEGVEKALNGNYSVVLMDLQMPKMDGYEATQVLRSKGYTKPIIALTAHAMTEERQRSLKNGFNNHLTKPIDNVALVQTLSEYTA